MDRPVKRKGGTAAGVPRPVGEGNPSATNGANKEQVCTGRHSIAFPLIVAFPPSLGRVMMLAHTPCCQLFLSPLACLISPDFDEPWPWPWPCRDRGLGLGLGPPEQGSADELALSSGRPPSQPTGALPCELLMPMLDVHVLTQSLPVGCRQRRVLLGLWQQRRCCLLRRMPPVLSLRVRRHG